MLSILVYPKLTAMTANQLELSKHDKLPDIGGDTLSFLDQVDRFIGIDESSVTDWLYEVEAVLRTRPDEVDNYFDRMAREQEADPQLLDSRETPPLGVHAVALVQQEEQWHRALLVAKGLAPDTGLSQPAVAGDFAPLRDLFADLGTAHPDEILVIGIDPPAEQYARVDGDLIGTLGLPVRLRSGSNGALTAGHVARRAESPVSVAGIQASVAYSNHRALHKADQNCADVAVLELPSGWRDLVNVPAGLTLSDPTDPLLLPSVNALNRSKTGDPGQIVRTAGASFIVNEREGRWGDFIMTDPISINGDSGSLVVAFGNLVIGQIVGGLEGAYSIVQNIHYLLDDADVDADIEIIEV